MKKIKLATVFSGIGSIEFALKRLNIDHEIVFACDNGERDISYDKNKEFQYIKTLTSIDEKKEYVDKLYQKNSRRENFVQISYLANYNIHHSRYFQDIRLLDGNDFYGQVDLFVGGSPCQSFSSIGYQQGLEDVRGTLFYDYARLVMEIKPKVFIYENVRGLINHDKKNTWVIISKIFESLGYKIYFSILNSKDYGIPQNRRRLFVVGFKENVPFEFPKPYSSLIYSMNDFLIDNCKEGNFINKVENCNINIIKDKGYVDQSYVLSEKVKNYVLKSGTKKFYQKPEINLSIARTILKTMGNRHRAGIDNYISVGNENIRMLTEREAHRLMGFTDDYKIVVSKSQAYKQAGNSIVVDVMMNIIKEIIKTNIFEDK